MTPHDGRSLRLFIAAELPDATRAALAAAIDALRRFDRERVVRWVRPEGIHVTLKFLGSVPPARVDAIRDALARAADGAAPFSLRPEGVGSFGGRRNLRVVWAGVGGDRDALGALEARVQSSIAVLGFPPEQRPFNPHLTLGRVRDDAPQEARGILHDALARFDAPPFAPFDVAHVSLMRSTLAPGGAVYDAIATFPLAAG